MGLAVWTRLLRRRAPAPSHYPDPYTIRDPDHGAVGRLNFFQTATAYQPKTLSGLT